MRCLILEENSTASNIIRVGLKAYGYSVDSQRTVERLGWTIEQKSYRLIIVDTGMPQLKTVVALRNLITEISNVETCSALALGIVKKHEWRKKVQFLNAGGDDVIEYPFSLQELLARIQALLRRSSKSTSSLLHLGDVSIDTANHQVTDQDNNVIELRKKEYNILEYMVRNKEKPISRSEILEYVWGYKRVVGSNTVDVHISNLRRKLPCCQSIQTVYGFGYKASDGRSTGYKKNASESDLKILNEL